MVKGEWPCRKSTPFALFGNQVLLSANQEAVVAFSDESRSSLGVFLGCFFIRFFVVREFCFTE